MTISTGYMTHKKTINHSQDLADFNETNLWSGKFFAARNKTYVLQALAQTDRITNKAIYKASIRDPNHDWMGIEFQMKSFHKHKEQVINIPGLGDLMASTAFKDGQTRIEFYLLPV